MSGTDTLDDGLEFGGYPQPPDVPPDPTGDDWRGPPGPAGPPGPGAAPSNTVPLMDGVGAAGTAGTASRGDHVHPSDTSLLPLLGGTVTGTLAANGGITFTSSNQTPAQGLFIQRTFSAPLTSGALQTSFTKSTINAGLGGQQYWMNYDELNYSGTTSGDSGDGIARYMATNRNVASPSTNLWAGIMQITDNTGLKSSLSGGSMLLEMDYTVSGADDIGPGRNRRFIACVLNKLPSYAGSDTQAYAVIDMTQSAAPSVLSVQKLINFNMGFSQAGIDFSPATKVGNPPAIRLNPGMSIDWDATNNHGTYWDSAALSSAGALHMASNVEIDGTLYVPNALTAGGLANFAGAGTGLAVTNNASVGGTLQANVLFTGQSTWTPANAALQPIIDSRANLAGIVSGTSVMNRFVVSSDTMDARLGSNGCFSDIGIYHSVGDSGSNYVNGGRQTIWAELTVGALTAPALQMNGIHSTLWCSSNTNGAFLQPLSTSVTLQSGAVVGSTGVELIVSAAAGTSVNDKYFLQCTYGGGDVIAGSGTDAGIRFASANAFGAPGAGIVISLGNPSQGWPVSATGTILGVVPQIGNASSTRNIHFIPRQAAAGIDFSLVDFTQANGYAFRSPGHSVDGTGQITMANALFGTTATGAQIDLPNQIVTAVAVAAGGGGGGSGTNDYYVGDILVGPNGGRYRVTTVASGAVSGVSVLTPGASAAPPANPVATSGASGVGCTLNLTWSVRNTLALNPSGGPITGAGPLTLNNNATVNGTLTANPNLNCGTGVGQPLMSIMGGAGNERALQFFTGNTAAGLRWMVRANAIAEGGGNAGSDFEIVSYSDTGAGIIGAMTITRATGHVSVAAGLDLGSNVGSTNIDLSHHLAIYGNSMGLSVTGGRLNYVVSSGNSHFFSVNNVDIASISASGVTHLGNTGFNGTAPIAKPTVTGNRAPSDTGLASLLTSLGNYGLITDSTTVGTDYLPTTGGGTVNGTLAVTGAISGAGFTNLFAAPSAIGSTTPAAGTFTTLAASAQILSLPAARGGTSYTVAATDRSLILAPTGTFTLTLPTASTSAGRIIVLKLTAAFAVNSAASNVVPMAGGSAIAAILVATAGKYAELQSDGTNWQIMSAN